MIENDNQLAVTKERLKELEEALKPAKNEYLLAKAHYESIASIISDLQREIREYEIKYTVTLRYNRGQWAGSILKNEHILWMDGGQEDLHVAQGIMSDAVKQYIPQGTKYDYREMIAKGNRSEKEGAE